MKLFNGMSPNGARVSVFLAEKGVSIPTEPIDLLAGETRTDAFRKINSLGEVPVLQLDDGRYLTESIAICRYLERLHPEPALFGNSAEQQAFIEMWIRRMELHLFNTIGDVGLHEFEFFRDKVEQNADYAAAQRRSFGKQLKWLDSEISDGRPFLSGSSFSMADVVGMATLMIADLTGIGIPGELNHVRKWEAGVRSRPSFPAMPKEPPELARPPAQVAE